MKPLVIQRSDIRNRAGREMVSWLLARGVALRRAEKGERGMKLSTWRRMDREQSEMIGRSTKFPLTIEDRTILDKQQKKVKAVTATPNTGGRLVKGH